ncbi:amidohydrolase family protein [Candidatus Uabimicrobium amorphum]|uniref:Amidohydrolase n=1 Tax=Uabimicrobium amorphum TaxID=2596890 RepID=A0A5S9F2N8_UABAM|nr:amidohydrolase family protein [Candidatus Uabimicrobium amorphum]BBM82564.1 amidohydrolase [Candidatus Uabimicrobium amorphum]
MNKWIMFVIFAYMTTGFAQESAPHAFVGARIIPVVGKPIEKGVIVIHKGKISAIGVADAVELPNDAVVHDATGQVILPGFVDTHSHIGGAGAGDSSKPLHPGTSVFDSFNVLDAGIQKAQAGGVTVANVMPGSGHLMSGQTIYIKMRDGRIINDLVIKNAEGKFMGGMKMANGTNSIRQAPFPGTRGKSAALVRALYIKAQEYRQKILDAKGDKTKMPPRDLGMEALVEVLEGKRIVHHHTHRHDDVMTVLRLQKEFGFRVVLHHVSEAWKIAKEIAAAKAPCSIIIIDSPGGKLEARDLDWKNGIALEKAGAVVGFHTDDPITDSRLFLRSAAFAVRAGMSEEAAIYGLTMAGAIMLDLQDRLGSLEVGKDADLVILSGSPLSVYTKIQETWVDGKKVFDRADAQDHLWAVGGYGAGEDRPVEYCCYGKGQ